MKRLRLTPEAELDLDEAYGWYRAQAPGLAASFLGAVNTCIAIMVRVAWWASGPAQRAGASPIVVAHFGYTLTMWLHEATLATCQRSGCGS